MSDKIRNSKILVTGGAGFVGSHLVEKLLKYDPEKIFIVDNMIRGSERNISSFINDPRIVFYRDDIRNESQMNTIMSQTDFCFHLAALRITRCADNPSEAFEVMAKATFNIIELAKRYRIKKLIYSSTASVYGMAKNFPTTEEENPYNNKTFYGAVKLFGESLLSSYHDMYGLNSVILRYFNIYGPRMDTEGKYTEVMIKWLDCIAENKRPVIYGDGSTSMDFVYVEDIADVNIAALLNEITFGIFNIGCQRETSLSELLKLLLLINKSSLNPEFAPENKINPVQRRIADISKSREILKFQPKVPLEEGLLKLSEWYYNLKNNANSNS